MILPLIVAGVLLFASSVVVLRAASRAMNDRRWTGGVVRGLVGLVFLSSAGLAAAVAVGLRGYRALTLEVLAATVTTEPVASQRFRATIVFPDRRIAMYDLTGDAFYVDARILKWHPLVNLLGLHTAYELD